MMLKVWLAPPATAILPEGSILPFAPALAVMVKLFCKKLASMVWLAMMLSKI